MVEYRFISNTFKKLFVVFIGMCAIVVLTVSSRSLFLSYFSFYSGMFLYGTMLYIVAVSLACVSAGMARLMLYLTGGIGG